MDFLTCHVGHLSRPHPGRFPVQNIGHVRKEAPHFIRGQRFATLNFSLVLGGGGTYRVDDGPEMSVQAPFVLTQCERHAYTYGPPPGGHWRELYLMYPLETRPAWEDIGLYNPAKQAWPIHNAAGVSTLVGLLLDALGKREGEGMADVIDRLCELLVLESRRQAPSRTPHPHLERLEPLRRSIDANPGKAVDFHRGARAAGLSYSAFRRYWRDCFGRSPGQYLADRRMQEARRLLAESTLPIGQVAHAVGFEDALYFSRRFHRHAGMTAGDYRRLNSHAPLGAR